MPEAELNEETQRIVLKTEFRDRELIRSVPGAKYDRATETWQLPVSWANCLTLRGVFGERLKVGDGLNIWASEELLYRIEPALDARQKALDVTCDTNGDPRAYPYQRTAVEFLERSGGCAVLADDMGCGKTVETILALERFNQTEPAYPVLIVCPNGVKRVWERHFADWAPHRSVTVIAGGVAARRKQLAEPADVTIINWEALRLHSRLAPYGSIRLTDAERTDKELNRPWATVIADEAHKIKDPKSKMTRALWSLSAGARYRVALTGTPVAQHPGDFWSILRFISPAEWPSRSKYIDRYCLTAWNPFGGLDIVGIHPAMSEEFFRVVDPRFLRRTKTQVLPNLPPKVYQTRFVELSAKQKKAYKELDDGMATDVEGGTVMAFNPLTKHGRLSQAASATLTLDDAGDVVLSEPSSKLDALEEIREEMGVNEPLIIFAESRKLLELYAVRLTKKRVTFGMVTGKISEAERQANIDAFQRGQLQAILITYGAGAEGITLTRSKTMIRLQRTYNLVADHQAEDRFCRPGAEVHDSLLIIDLVSEGTVEEDVPEAIAVKDGMLDDITRDSLRDS